MSAITLNGLRCVSARFVFPYQGPWFADVDVDPDVIEAAIPLTLLPTPIVLVVDAVPPVTLLGVVDPRYSGTFVASARFRVVGGHGGWDKQVRAQQFAPGAVLSTLVYETTALEVLETVADLEPTILGVNYARSAGPARRVLDAASGWWVDPVTGITFVGPRPPAIPDLSLEVLEWDATSKTATAACDTLILPGTPLVDARIGESPVTVRDVEQTFGPDSVRATLWCSSEPESRLTTALRNAVLEFAGVVYSRIRMYRFVAGTAGAMALQAVSRDPLTGEGAPLPDLLAIPEWSGVSGITTELAPSLEVLVGFVDGDPTEPVVLGYSTLAPPITMTVEAAASVEILAPSVTVGPVPLPLASAPPVLANFAGLGVFLAALATYAAGIQPIADPGPPPGPLTSPLLAAIAVLEGELTSSIAEIPTKILEAT
jgi:hypothetical protein